jgi:hypothetical protein
LAVREPLAPLFVYSSLDFECGDSSSFGPVVGYIGGVLFKPQSVGASPVNPAFTVFEMIEKDVPAEPNYQIIGVVQIDSRAFKPKHFRAMIYGRRTRMLKKGTSKAVFEENLKTEMAAGRPKKQALAISYAKKRSSAKKKKR